MQCTLMSALLSLSPSRCSPFYAPRWVRTAYLGVVLLVLLLQNDVPYDEPYNDKDGTSFRVQFQHFFQAFFLRYDRTTIPLNCELEHGLRNGMIMEQLVQGLSPYQACRIPGCNKPYGARSIVHYLTMDHITTMEPVP
jgi:hypothetical protein